MLSEITAEELTAALDDCAGRLLTRGGVHHPPVEATALAQALGMTLAWDSAQAGRARIVRLSAARGVCGGHSILLRPEPRPERRQWAVAHEIGETAAEQVFSALGIDPRAAPADSRERIANMLAGRLLLPHAWFLRDALVCNWDLLQLKQKYSTASHELIARRMLDFALPSVITIYDQGQISFRRASGQVRCGPPLSVEIACWQMVRKRQLPCRLREGGQTASGWPIYETHWKREILRLELPELAE